MNSDLSEVVQVLDWTPFFQTWSLFGQYPAILDDKVVGEQARKVYAEGQAMLKKIIEGRWLTASGVVAFYPANTVNDDDIEIYRDERSEEHTSELQSLMRISYAVFCLKKKKKH